MYAGTNEDALAFVSCDLVLLLEVGLDRNRMGRAALPYFVYLSLDTHVCTRMFVRFGQLVYVFDDPGQLAVRQINRSFVLLFNRSSRPVGG